MHDATPLLTYREQDNNSKHLQLVSGAPPTAYWAANYLWDLLAFSGSAAGIVGLVAAYRYQLDPRDSKI